MPDAGTNSVEGQDEDGASLPSTAAPTRSYVRGAGRRIAVIGVLLGLGFAFFALANSARKAAITNTHRNNLKLINLGLLNYRSANGFLPNDDVRGPAGTVLSSWRFDIHPYVNTWDIVRDFGSGWDAPSNRLFAEMHDPLYCWDAAAPRETSVLAVTGPDTVFDGTRRNVVDIPEDLILVMEVRDSKINWMQPGDYRVTDLLSYEGRISDHLHGSLNDCFLVLFADGEIWALDPDAPIADLHPFLTITGAKTHDRDELLAPHKVN